MNILVKIAPKYQKSIMWDKIMSYYGNIFRIIDPLWV